MKKIMLTSLKIFLFAVGWILFVSIFSLIKVNTPSLKRLWLEFVPFLIVILFTIGFVCIVEKKKIKVKIFSDGLRNTIIGLVTGFFWIGSAFGILYLTGTIQIKGFHKVEYLWVWIIASLLNTTMQELLVRGYIYQLIKKNYNAAVSITITTILFTAMHVGAFESGLIPVVNVITMSLFVSFLLEYTGSLLAPIIVHFIWNTIGAIVLGGVSLASDYPHILNSIYSGEKFLSGGSCKIEGSIVVLGINVILATLFIFLTLRTNQKRNS